MIDFCPYCNNFTLTEEILRDNDESLYKHYFHCKTCGHDFIKNAFGEIVDIKDIDTFINSNKPEKAYTKLDSQINLGEELEKMNEALKHNDRNDTMELLYNIMNLCHAEYHLCEAIQINKDEIYIGILNEQLTAIRHERIQAMLVLGKIRPAVKGLWCVIKHLLMALFHSYEIYERTKDTNILEIAHNTNLIIDELLSYDEFSNLKECPRCENEKTS